MNRFLFYSMLIFITLLITFGAIYFLNLSNMNEVKDNNSSVRDTNLMEMQTDINKMLPTPELYSPEQNQEANIPTLNNQDLSEIEKELNSLDLDSELDIE